MIDRDFAALQRVAESSALWRGLVATGSIVQRAWADSRVANGISRVVMSIAGASMELRIRVVAMTIAWAAAGYGASLLVAPPYVRSGIPLSVILAIATIALVVSLSAEGFAKSWAHSSLRESLRR